MDRLYDFINVTVRYPYPSITTNFDIVLPKRLHVAGKYLWAWFVCPAFLRLAPSFHLLRHCCSTTTNPALFPKCLAFLILLSLHQLQRA